MVILKEKVYPGLDEFKNLSDDYNVIPVIRKISGDLDTPITLFSKLQSSESCFLLESAEDNGRCGRFSIIGRKPNITLEVSAGKVVLKAKEQNLILPGNPFDVIEGILKNYKIPQFKDFPRYLCGMTGYFGYDMIRHIERISLGNKDDFDLPEAILMVPEEVAVYDHYKQQIYLVANCFLKDEDRNEQILKESYQRAIDTVNKLERIIRLPFDQRMMPRNGENSDEITIRSNMTMESYMESVVKAKEYIRNGDIFQVVLSQRLKTNLNGSDFDVYRKLRLLNPSPYMYFLKFKGFSIVGTSPEMLVRVTDDRVETCPIAGTRKRGTDQDEDIILENDLLSDEKELAEHTMLVDLGRNDVGRVSKYGTVKVNNFMHVERFSHVMHIVSNVEGQRLEDKSLVDILKAVMPAGTVSGAPKVRAMEIIEELETAKRGIYSGAVGYLGFDGNMDTCITIRTAVIKGNEVYVQAGAGIVADSDPEKEYVETMNKAKALISALGS